MAAKVDDFAICHLERAIPARVPAFAYSKGMMSRFEQRLDRLVVVDRADTGSIHQDLEATASELNPEAKFTGYPERC